MAFSLPFSGFSAHPRIILRWTPEFFSKLQEVGATAMEDMDLVVCGLLGMMAGLG